MKKGLLIAFASLMLATSAWAGAPYVGIYATNVAESDAPHSICSIYPEPETEVFVMWIWILPSPAGLSAYEFKLKTPTGLGWMQDEYGVPVGTGEEWNPYITIKDGSWTGNGQKGAFPESYCMTDWTWIYKRWYITYSSTARIFQILPHVDTGHIYIASCEPGHPLYDGTVLTHLYMFQPCVYATQESTWGAIKSMF